MKRIRILTLIISIFIGLALASAQRLNTASAQTSGMTLIWSDEFSGASGTGVDTNNWKYDTGNGIFGTGEIETMTNSTANVYQDGAGHLVIKALRDGSGNWTSGRIETQRADFQPPAGGILHIESSFQQPNVSGAAAAGYWPAFWMLGAPLRSGGTWPGVGEWDIMEDINGLSSVFGTLHCGVNPGGPCNESTGIGSGQKACNGCQTGFHTYAIEYDQSVSPEQLRWYLDGVNYFTINSTQLDATTWNNATHRPNFIIYDLAMGGGFPAAFGGGPTGSTQSGAYMLIDYVRVYTKGSTVSGDGNPYSGSPYAIPGKVEAENYNTGGEGVAYHDTDSTNNGGQYRPSDGVDIEASTDTGGGYNVGWTAGGEWMKYTVNVASSGTYNFDFRVASAQAGGAFHLEVDNTNVTGALTVPNTGGWQNWTDVTANNINLTAGQHVFKWVTDAAGGNYNWFNVAPVSGDGTPYSGSPYTIPGKVESENYNKGGQNVAYNFTVQGTAGSPYRSDADQNIEPTTDTGAGYDVGWTAGGEWMKYTVNVASSGKYNFDFRVASAQAGGTFHLEVDNTNVTGSLTVPNTGGWQNWTDVTANNINLTAGQHVFKWVTDAAGGNYNWFSVSQSGTGPTSTPVPPTATFVPPTATPGSGTPAWQPNTAYAVGALVTYGGHTYSCLQAHTSQVGWEPPNVPALWKLIS
jgi:hypothetical protein